MLLAVVEQDHFKHVDHASAFHLCHGFERLLERGRHPGSEVSRVSIAIHPLSVFFFSDSLPYWPLSRLIRFTERPNDDFASPVLYLAIYEVCPPLQHFTPLIRILRPVVNAPDALGFMRKTFLDPV